MNLFIRKKPYNLLDKYDILDDTGRIAYIADGLLIRIKGNLIVRDRAGTDILTIKKSANFLYANYEIETADGLRATMLQQFNAAPFFKISADRENFILRGNLRACDFDISNGEIIYARIRKRNLRWGDTYVLSLSDMQYAPVFCAFSIAADNALFHNL